jgi:hypothetical protein
MNPNNRFELSKYHSSFPLLYDAHAQFCIYLTPRQVRRTSIVLRSSDHTVQSEMHKATILIANVAEATNLFDMC